MSFNFPATPTIGQEYDTGTGLIYVWNGYGWIIKPAAAATIPDGDKGDIIVSAGGTSWMIDSGVITTAARSVLDDATTAAMRATLVAEPAISGGTTSQFWRGDKSWQAVPPDDWSVITNKPALEPAIAGGTTAQYWRGDKSWQTLPVGGLIRISTTTVSGTTVVALPAGYDKFIAHFVGLTASASVNPFIRFSHDGSTFLTTSVYFYGFMTVSGASTVAGAQASGTSFALFGSAPDLATAGITGNAELNLFPGAASQPAQGYLEAMHWTSGAMRVSTQGLYLATSGRVQALQLSVPSGALTGGKIHLYGLPS